MKTFKQSIPIGTPDKNVNNCIITLSTLGISAVVTGQLGNRVLEFKLPEHTGCSTILSIGVLIGQSFCNLKS